MIINSTFIIICISSVKYRGIFISDEAPAFSGWTKEKFGGENHLVYKHMFELNFA
ncbi:MAG: glycosyl hydrolase 115 family protein [Ilyomonas sp.]